MLASFAVPAWAIFDRLLEPRDALFFLLIRLSCDVPVLLLTWLLWARPIGRRRPEILLFCIVTVVQAEIAFMTVRATNARDSYLLGLSLAIYACGCGLAGRVRWTAAAVAITWLSLIAADLTAPTHLGSHDVVTAGFYLSTASFIALVAHAQRARLTRGELEARSRLEAEQHRAHELLTRLERLSHEDALTGLANRRRWDDELLKACDRARRAGTELAIILIDVDRFKRINDQFGHTVGDQALIAVAGLLRARTRQGDLVARLGGDEFGMLLVGSDTRGATDVAGQLQRLAMRALPERDFPVTLSLGVASAIGPTAQPDALVAGADKQLYRAKVDRNTVASPDG